ncbi:MAG: M56 family metallopeptidase [Pseudomonadota bacterium]
MVATSEMLWIVWAATLAVGVAALLLMVLPRLLRRRFGAGVAYAAWWLLPVALIASLLPARVVETTVLPGVLQAAARPVTTMPVETIVDRSHWWLAAWLVGAIAMALRFWWQQRRFERALGELRPLRDRLWRAQASHGLPAVVGAVRARIVLPADFAERYDSEQRKLMLAHERRHLHSGDPLANLAITIVRCLFWFNPLVHLAASRFRHDQELACDQAVVAAHPNSRRAYGEAMLKTLMTDRQAPLGCHWGFSHPMKERVMQLKSPMPRAWVRRAGIAAVATLALGTGFVVWSAQPGRVVVRTPATTVDDADMLADIRVKIDDGALSPSGLRPIRFGDRMEYTYRDAGEELRLLATVQPAGKGRFDIQASLERDGKVVATPRLITEDGKPAVVRVGEDTAAGGFNGVEVTMFLTSNTAPPMPPAPPEPPPAPPAPPAPPPPPVPQVKHAGSGAIAPSPPQPPTIASPAPPMAPVPRSAPAATPAPHTRAAAPTSAARASAPVAAEQADASDAAAEVAEATAAAPAAP